VRCRLGAPCGALIDKSLSDHLLTEEEEQKVTGLLREFGMTVSDLDPSVGAKFIKCAILREIDAGIAPNRIRVEGKRRFDGLDKVPSFLGAVIKAVTDAKITPAEGESLASIIDKLQSAVALIQLEQRVEQIEASTSSQPRLAVVK
jgi:hypothetical protein